MCFLLLQEANEVILNVIIIMVIFKCYFSGEHIALSINKKQNKKNNNNGENKAKADASVAVAVLVRNL